MHSSHNLTVDRFSTRYYQLDSSLQRGSTPCVAGSGIILTNVNVNLELCRPCIAHAEYQRAINAITLRESLACSIFGPASYFQQQKGGTASSTMSDLRTNKTSGRIGS